jgi:hypothetical protein
MEKKRYAFLVENEIFHILPIAGNYEDKVFLRWSNGFLNEPKVLDISEIPDVAIASIWNGEGFDNSFLTEESLITQVRRGEKKYALINKENVVFMILELTNSPSMLKNAFEAAFSTGSVIAMDITDFPESVSYWWTWDGESFSPPEES